MLFDFLEYLESFRSLQIVRFVAQFFTQERIAPQLARIKALMDQLGVEALAARLLRSALWLVIIVFVIDQIFFWTHPLQRKRALRFLHNMRYVWRCTRIFVLRCVRSLRKHLQGGRA